jgi:hypothetical protein
MGFVEHGIHESYCVRIVRSPDSDGKRSCVLHRHQQPGAHHVCDEERSTREDRAPARVILYAKQRYSVR